MEHKVTPGVKPCTKSGTHRKDAARGIISRIAIAGNTLKPDIAPRMDFPFKEALKKVANKGRFGFATNQGGQRSFVIKKKNHVRVMPRTSRNEEDS